MIKKNLLDQVKYPEDLRKLSKSDLKKLIVELREELIDVVSTTGGHLGAGLGVVELTIALHYVFNTPQDKLVWDVGHQAYPHKIITGRRNNIRTLRKGGGLSGFTKRSESEYDPFGAAHSSTSISSTLGMAVAKSLSNNSNHVIAVIGDGAMSAGMAYEAMNNAGAMKSKLIVILNDNDMSIARPVGAMSSYLARLLSGKTYFSFREIVKSITGKEAFVLWDTFGFPVEEIDAIAQENSLKVNLQEFNDEMEFQRNRARETAKFGGDRAKIRVYESLGVGSTGFMGYDHLEVSSVVVGLIVADQVVDEVKKGQDAEIALLQTSFYPEGGGQIGDSGRIFNEHSTINIIDTKTVMPGLIMHFGAVQEGVIRLGDPVEAQVNKITRKDCARNHTATHMLHAALRQVLGDHVRQAGSLVAPERIRFDFTHVKQLTNDELFRVQQLVNDKIRQNFSVHKSEDSYQSAIKKGALAFFGDKYENMVRVIEIANGATFSLEVCGGTHVERTGEIGGMYLLSETSVGAGVRRLEAITGRAAETLVWERFSLQSRIANQLQTNIGDLEKRIESLLGDLASTKQEKDSLQKQLTLKSVDPLLELVKVINGVKVLSVKISVNNVDSLREVGDYLRDKLGSCIVVLGCEMNKRANLIAMVTDDLVKNGFNASDIIRNIAKSIEGGGGGKENIAQAGGKRVDKLDQALADVYLLIEQNGMK